MMETHPPLLWQERLNSIGEVRCLLLFSAVLIPVSARVSASEKFAITALRIPLS